MAEQLHRIGKRVSVIELQPRVLPQLDPEMARPLENALRENGVELILGDGIEGFAEIAGGLSIKLKSGATLEAELVILSIGVRPESTLAEAAGIGLGPRGHIIVDAHHLTSDPEIYAVGDVCETTDPILGKRAAIPLGGPANRQGRTAADHIFLGEKALPYPGSIGTAIVRVFENVAGFAAGNIRDGMLIPVPDLRSAGAQIIDVRPAASAAERPVPGAKNIPLGELRMRLSEIDRTPPVFTICQMGKTSYFAARILANHGFDARSILGGAHHQVR